MYKHTPTLVLLVFCLYLVACAEKQHPPSFIHIKNGQFMKNGQPYYYVGTNFWYGPILASEGEGGNRDRLHKELDLLKNVGVDNLRILVGSDGKHGVVAKIEPTLQTAPGVYNDTILAGLDYLLAEMSKRDMSAVLYLNNSWEWSGGYSQYLEWAGYGKAPIPALDGWRTYSAYVAQFVQSDSAKALFSRYLNDIITRTNRYTGVKYTDDPTIMSWQIGNEPRAFSTENKEAFAYWMSDVAAQIKSLDHNHLVSSGSEGSAGCEQDITLYERIHADTHIDYLNIHIWPYNWRWISKDSLPQTLPNAIEHTRKYMDEHLTIAAKYQKPIVLEEFGFPRDGFQFTKESSTYTRDAYYTYIFEYIADEANKGSLFAGCNFWAWGGFAELPTDRTSWQKGDDYTGDPAQEPQGLNSVFASDHTTLDIIQAVNKKLNKTVNQIDISRK